MLSPCVPRVLLGSLLTLCCLLLSACGFYMQGQGNLPPKLKTVHVAYQAQHSVVPSALAHDLKDLLRGRGAIVTDSSDTAKTVLTLSPPDVVNQFNTVTGNGADKSYTLSVTEEYSLLDQSTGRTLHLQVSVSQDYSYNGNVAAARQEEVQRLRDGMRKELAERIFLQIRAASSPGYKPSEDMLQSEH